MRRLLWLALLAACSSKRVPEDYWYPEAEILCQSPDCPACHGSRGVTCPTCWGKGEVRCDDCDGSGQRRCSNCGGDGRYKDGECDDCKGRGRRRCSDCGGDGWETCRTCDGKRKIACLRRMPVLDPPARAPEDAWPPGNYQGGGAKK